MHASRVHKVHAARTQAFALEHLSRDSLLAYHHQLLVGYAGLYRGAGGRSSGRPSHPPHPGRAECPARDLVPNLGLAAFPGGRVALCKRAPRRQRR